MILDRLNNHCQYEAIHRLFPAAFRFIETCNSEIEPGRYELSEGMYALVQSYSTKLVDGTPFEAHRDFIDIQYVMEGKERIDYAQVTDLEAGEYQPEKDYLPLKGNGQPFFLDSGKFGIFFPQDAHLPSRIVEKSEPVKKIVIKVPL